MLCKNMFISISNSKRDRLVGKEAPKISLLSAPEYIVNTLNQFLFEHNRVRTFPVHIWDLSSFYIMKISLFFVVILLLVNFTLIESVMMRGATGAGLRGRSQMNTRRRFYRPKSSSSYRQYYRLSSAEANEFNANKFVEAPRPPDRSLMENPKRLKFLAANKKQGKSNIGRLLSGI